MGWFNQQVRERLQSDQSMLEDSFLQIANSILGDHLAEQTGNKAEIAKQALNDILKYYHQKTPEIPDSVKGLNERIEYVLRPLGLMTRSVKLESGWYRDAFGPMLGFMKESGNAVALLPGRLFGYWFHDPNTGKHIKLNKKNAHLLDDYALCFYQPLPLKKLGISDLLLFMKNSISISDFWMILMAAIAVTLIGMIEPSVYRLVTGPVLESKDHSMLLGVSVFLLSSAFAGELINAVRNLIMARISTKTSLSVEAAVMMRILSLPVSFFRDFSSGELSNRAASVNQLCGTILSNVVASGLTSLTSLLYITQIFSFTPFLVLPALLIILSTVLFSFITSLIQIRIVRKKMKLAAEESGITFAMFSGIQKIKLSGAEKRAFSIWARHYSQSAQLEYNPPIYIKLQSVILRAVGLIGTIVLYYIAVQSHISPSSYTAFMAAYGRVMGAFSSLATIMISFANLRPVLELAEPILNAEPEIATNKQIVETLSGNIEMSHVSFRYNSDTPLVLNDLSLKIRKGEYVAIVGKTGCGKSTLVHLLLGFEKPEQGAVYYDGKDLNSLEPKSLRKKMGIVTQDGQLFQGDIYSNITISAPALSLQDAWEAAEIAGIADDIRNMPMGMHTIISEGQGGISGGQKQRIMIARAIAHKPRILILDEATSALDNKTQKRVSEALDQLKCTRIVVAHRLSTIQNCDRILVLDQGKVCEEGSYNELINKNGIFANLVSRQRLEKTS